MQPTEKPIVITTKAILAQFPKGHMLAAGVLAVCLGVWASTSPSKPAPALETITIDAIEADNAALDPPQEPLEPLTQDLTETLEEEVSAVSLGVDNDLLDTVPEASADTSEYLWTEKSYTVKSGDNLSIIFKRAGLSDRDLYELTGNNAEAKQLTRIMPGHEIIFTIDDNNKLQRLS
ncbi:MAG TPA: LysM-like peptidoglycan-binding domain-containing protein, partial [Cellvibrionaceae bacterium]